MKKTTNEIYKEYQTKRYFKSMPSELTVNPGDFFVFVPCSPGLREFIETHKKEVLGKYLGPGLNNSLRTRTNVQFAKFSQFFRLCMCVAVTDKERTWVDVRSGMIGNSKHLTTAIAFPFELIRSWARGLLIERGA
jgi:hypothetical protein